MRLGIYRPRCQIQLHLKSLWKIPKVILHKDTIVFKSAQINKKKKQPRLNWSRIANTLHPRSVSSTCYIYLNGICWKNPIFALFLLPVPLFNSDHSASPLSLSIFGLKLWSDYQSQQAAQQNTPCMAVWAAKLVTYFGNNCVFMSIFQKQCRAMRTGAYVFRTTKSTGFTIPKSSCQRRMKFFAIMVIINVFLYICNT